MYKGFGDVHAQPLMGEFFVILTGSALLLFAAAAPAASAALPPRVRRRPSLADHNAAAGSQS